MSHEEMKKRAAKGKMGQETPGDLRRHPQGSDAVRSMGMADPLSSQLSFQATSYQVGRSPSGVAVGDFTNDGNLDIIVANALDNTVSVLQNNGDGTFTAAASSPYNVGANPAGVAVGDFANNGYLDFVTANIEDNTVSFLLRPLVPWALSTSVGTRPSGGVAVGDFANNGYLGIVTANQDSTVSVLLTPFGPEYSYNVGQGPSAVAVGDFMNDGNLDIVTVNALDGTVSVLQNNGDGTFRQHQDYNVGAFPWGVAVGDFNNDGYLDIVTANNDDHTVSILQNNGDGTFQEPPLTFPVGQGPIAVAVGDFTNDGNLDIVTANYSANTVSVLLGNGDGTFQEPPLTFPVGYGPWAWSVAVGDFNNDGYLDIVTSDIDGNTVTVLLQQPPPPLEVQVNTIQATATVPFNGAVATISGASSASDTRANIDWGDGTSATSGTVSANPDGTLTVSGTHTYTTVGIFTLTVSATEGTTRSGQGTDQASVSSGPTVQVNTIYPTEQVDFRGVVATISGASSTSFINATIDWGDGTSSQPNVFIENPDGTLSVIAEHTYLTPGTFTLTVNVTVDENSVQGTGQAIVLPGLEMQVNTIQATAQVPFSGAVATISGASSASDTLVIIDWGDGGNTSVPVSANNDGTLTATGTHTYTAPGTYTLIGSADEGTLHASGTGQAIVQSATAVQVVQVKTIHATAHVPFHGTVATITGANSASDTTVMINWGDGTAATPGTVVANLNGTLRVSGSHTYSRGGTFRLSVTVREGARTATGKGQAIVEADRVKATRLHARAFGVRSLTPPQAPFGDVSIPSMGGTQTVTVPSVRLPGNGLRVRAITDRVSGVLTTTPPLASASSEIADLHGFGIAASGISATAHADLSRLRGLRGTTTFASLAIDSTTFPAHFAPQANRVIPLADGSGTVTLNEQTVTRRGNRLLIVVNALHLRITTGPQAGTDIVVGHAEAGITLS